MIKSAFSLIMNIEFFGRPSKARPNLLATTDLQNKSPTPDNDSEAPDGELEDTNVAAVDNRSHFVYKGVIWLILAWRMSNNRRQYVVEHRSLSPEPDGHYLSACSLINEEDLPIDLLAKYNHDPRRNLTQSGVGLNMTRRAKDEVGQVRQLAWNSHGKALFTLDKKWYSFISNLSHGTNSEADLLEHLNEVMVEVEWRDGCTTWESGETCMKLYGGTVFLCMWPYAVSKTAIQWGKIQEALEKNSL